MQHNQKKKCLGIGTGAAYQNNFCSYCFLTSKLSVFGKFVVYQYQVHVLCLSRQGTFYFLWMWVEALPADN
jgi:hypothetical protein